MNAKQIKPLTLRWVKFDNSYMTNYKNRLILTPSTITGAYTVTNFQESFYINQPDLIACLQYIDSITDGLKFND